MQIRLGEKELKTPKEINKKVSDRLNIAITKGMKLDPEARPQTIKEWLDLLPSLSSNTKANQLWKWLMKIVDNKRLWMVLAFVITALLTLTPETLKERIMKPFIPSSSTPESVESPSQD